MNKQEEAARESIKEYIKRLIVEKYKYYYGETLYAKGSKSSLSSYFGQYIKLENSNSYFLVSLIRVSDHEKTKRNTILISEYTKIDSKLYNKINGAVKAGFEFRIENDKRIEVEKAEMYKIRN